MRPDVLLRALTAHAIAEAMLNAPQLFGSLQLLLNPTGLVQSVQRGMADLINLPMAGWYQRSATQFFAGVGRGSASLLTGVSGKHFALFASVLGLQVHDSCSVVFVPQDGLSLPSPAFRKLLFELWTILDR